MGMDHFDAEQLHRRLDKQDDLLAEIKDTITKHLAAEESVKPALDELISLWKGTKVLSRLILGLGAIGATVYSVFLWAKDHIK